MFCVIWRQGCGAGHSFAWLRFWLRLREKKRLGLTPKRSGSGSNRLHRMFFSTGALVPWKKAGLALAPVHPENDRLWLKPAPALASAPHECLAPIEVARPTEKHSIRVA